jgi:selenocysteine lyase/cysteine desulfurase
MTLACQRPLFDLPDDLVYLNCAAQSPCLTESAEAGRRAVSRKWHPWDPERAKVGAEMERCRSLFAGLIGAEARDIAITFTTSYGTAIAAANLSIRPGQSVVLLQDQFPSHYYA